MTPLEPDFAVVGDCLLDVVVRPGGTAALGADVPARIVVGAGGQAANVAVRLARRRRTVRLVAPVGDDAAGQLLRAALASDGVELGALPATRSGIVTALVAADGERTMYSDRVPLDARAVMAAIGRAPWIHVSAYALLGKSGAELAASIAGRAALTAQRISVNGGSVVPGASAERLADTLSRIGPALVVFDRREAAALLAAAAATARDAASALAQRLRCLAVVTDGPAGAVAAWPDGGVAAAPAMPVRSVDATGAGDAFAAAFIDTVDRGSWPPTEAALADALAAGTSLASRVVGVIGAQARVDGELAPASAPVTERPARRVVGT